MPALVLFSRRWNIGSDDFLFFPVLSAIVRSFWIGCIVAEWGVIVGHFRSIETCENGLEVELYFLGALVLQVLFVAEELVLTYAASKGGTMVPSARHSVPKILVVRLALWIIELCWTVFGSYVMITQQGCAQDSRLHEVVFDGFVVSEWVLVSAYFAIWYLAWDPVGKRTHVHGLSHRHEEAYHQNWAKRVRRACAFTTVEVEAFEEIAALFANLFRNVDLVPSDVAVGLVLLRKQQKRDNRNLVASTNINYRDGSRASIVGCHMVGRRRSSASGRLLCLPDADRALMFTLVRFMKYAFGAYGWPMFMVQNKACGCCLLCRGRCAMELVCAFSFT
ncbi:hypothetical protein DIPPA_31907 [Diplonema papillatum]|nr:hypothetical protein DIPPA_31907 [Diplonema papillatum]